VASGQAIDCITPIFVIQMLLENIAVNVSQEEITEAAGATHTIETHGTRVDQLASSWFRSAFRSRPSSECNPTTTALDKGYRQRGPHVLGVSHHLESRPLERLGWSM
jgi:hypothetical protein